MKSLSVAILISSITLTASGEEQRSGIYFDSHPDRQRFAIGESFTESEAVITMGGFYGDHNDNYEGGVGMISSHCFFGSSINQLSLSNVTAEFDYPSSISGASIKFEYLGGPINLIINDELFVGSTFQELPSSLGGVSVSCSGSCKPAGVGQLTLTGTIDSLAVGGQQLCLKSVMDLK